MQLYAVFSFSVVIICAYLLIKGKLVGSYLVIIPFVKSETIVYDLKTSRIAIMFWLIYGLILSCDAIYLLLLSPDSNDEHYVYLIWLFVPTGILYNIYLWVWGDIDHIE